MALDNVALMIPFSRGTLCDVSDPQLIGREAVGPPIHQIIGRDDATQPIDPRVSRKPLDPAKHIRIATIRSLTLTPIPRISEASLLPSGGRQTHSCDNNPCDRRHHECHQAEG